MYLDPEQAATWLEAMAEQQAGRAQLKYIAPADEGDVMYEQLDYLLDHAADCPPACPDCRRLVEVTTLLMRPFARPK